MTQQCREVRRKANVGERIKITGNSNGHDFEIGEVVVVTKRNHSDAVVAEYIGGVDYWYVHDNDYTVIETVESALDTALGVTVTQESRITSAADEVRDTLIRKNRDYGDSFAKQYAKYGIMSGLIRMDDKMARLTNLTVGGAKPNVDESVEDTLLDLAGYALLCVVELRKQRKEEAKPL